MTDRSASHYQFIRCRDLDRDELLLRSYSEHVFQLYDIVDVLTQARGCVRIKHYTFSSYRVET